MMIIDEYNTRSDVSYQMSDIRTHHLCVGLEWLLERVEAGYDALTARIKVDMAERKAQEKAKREAKAKE